MSHRILSSAMYHRERRVALDWAWETYVGAVIEAMTEKEYEDYQWLLDHDSTTNEILIERLLKLVANRAGVEFCWNG